MTTLQILLDAAQDHGGTDKEAFLDLVVNDQASPTLTRGSSCGHTDKPFACNAGDHRFWEITDRSGPRILQFSDANG
jgi:hypothetical protein